MYGMQMWWIWWMLFMVLMLMPVGYGWGYRGWGPPYPQYVQRRRMQRASSGGSSGAHHMAWGWRGDLVWVFVFLAAVWLVWSVVSRGRW